MANAHGKTRAPVRPRTPGFVYGALALGIVVLLGVIALTQNQPPPPSIAEFAPQAVEQIKESPPELSGRDGVGSGADGPGGLGSLAGQQNVPRPVIDVPRVKRCVGDPPRQTEDPQSPPCVPYWEGDNGGATWKGVTRNEIRVVINGDDLNMEQFAVHFNTRYQFYGRQLRLKNVGCGGGVTGMKNAAVAVDENHKAFAALHCGDQSGREFVYYDELARRQIISVNNRPTMATEKHFVEHHPYQWSFLPGFDGMATGKADFVCASLAGRNADFAGGAEAGKPRVFGIVYTSTGDGNVPDLAPLRNRLATCGLKDLLTRQVIDSGEQSSAAASAQSVAIDLRLAGVTTVLCECRGTTTLNYLWPASTDNAYFPEWIISTYMYQDEWLAPKADYSGQAVHTFGLSWQNKQVTREESPWHWAVQDANPGRQYEYSVINNIAARYLYHPLLLLASGIQLAGPNLTPDTFAAGLQRARFPNPGASGPPYYQAHVGFQGDHTMVNDAALIWASKSERDSWEGGTGAWCWARAGLRYGQGANTWPKDSGGVFEPPCY